MGSHVLVIGSGPVGASAARRISEHGLAVTLVEQGPEITEPRGSHLRNAERFQEDPDSYLDEIQPYLDFFDTHVGPEGLPGAQTSALFGGQGLLWTNNCPRTDSVLERWPGIDDADWDRLYETAERYLGVTASPTGSARQKRISSRLAPSLASGRSVVDQPMAGEYIDPHHIHYAATADILGDVSGGIDLRQGAARSLLHDGTAVRGVDLDGEQVEADHVVVAAGAFGTPLLLHRSGIQPPALGRWLTFHNVLITQVILDEDLAPPSTVADFPPRLMIPPATAHPWHIMVLRDTSPFTPSEPDLDIPEHRLVEIQAFCPVDVREDNRMDLDQEPARFDVPVRTEDEARRVACEEEVARIAGTLGRVRAGCGPQWMDVGFAHVMGTCRMGSDPSTSVADLFGRVHGFTDLWLATVGLIPSRVAVNPTLTGLALAIRTADRLAEAHPSATGEGRVSPSTT